MLTVANQRHVRHDANIEPSQEWYNDEEGRENEANNHDDPNASCQRATHALNHLSPIFSDEKKVNKQAVRLTLGRV